ncbi:MAG: hypothetical protein M3O24_00390 [Thermoproteota archaeon]|nr:hypothetical protein [Thermoproteota archaeon]
MPKRKVKEEKPRKRMTRKQILIPPLIVGVATLGGLAIMHFLPSPSPIHVCLKAHNVDTFSVHSRIQIQVNGKGKLLPSDVGREHQNGKECLHVIHTDQVGDVVHIQFVRPIRLTLGDFMKIYAADNKTITVVDNSSGIPTDENITLSDYNIDFSYYSDKGFAQIQNLTQSPPFTDSFLGRINLRSK